MQNTAVVAAQRAAEPTYGPRLCAAAPTYIYLPQQAWTGVEVLGFRQMYCTGILQKVR